MFRKILIANRGEIAIRIVQACREMNIGSVAVFSDADADHLHVRLADTAVHIGPALSRKSYLNADAIIAAARSTGAEAIHPGYGFLSENADFARRCQEAGIVFIGPTAECIQTAGEKAAARNHVASAGVAVIPGSEGVVTSESAAAALAQEIGYPVIIKASGGGGGRGMRIAHDQNQLTNAFGLAAGEARAAFGNAQLYLEKYIDRPRHVEIQILADNHGNCIFLGERECSIQKRYQKLIEESPSPLVDEELRQAMGAAAVRVAQTIGYTNAGTIEFLVDADKNFYFMEVNARIQVEHPVTEWVTGIDLIRQQIRLAAGQQLQIAQQDVKIKGWAMECRINAADPQQDFMPSPGEITELILPHGPGVRVDTLLYPGCLVTPFYDSLICKLSVWDKDRPAAIRRMLRALAGTQIKGIAVTVPFHQQVLEDPAFVKGDFDTHFLNRFEPAAQSDAGSSDGGADA